MVLNYTVNRILVSLAIVFGGVLDGVMPCFGKLPHVTVLTMAESTQFDYLRDLMSDLAGNRFSYTISHVGVIAEWRRYPDSESEQHFSPNLLTDQRTSVLLIDVDLSGLEKVALDSLVKYVDGHGLIFGIGNGLNQIALNGEGESDCYDFALNGFGYRAIQIEESARWLLLNKSFFTNVLNTRVEIVETRINACDAFRARAELTDAVKPIATSDSGIPVAWSFKRRNGGMSYYIDTNSDENIRMQPFAELIESVVLKAVTKNSVADTAK